MKLCTGVGGLGGVVYSFMRIVNMRLEYKSTLDLIAQLFRINGFLGYLLGMVIASLALVLAFKPNDPIPWHWLILLFFGVLIILLSHLWSGISVLTAGIVGLLKKA
ncbi:MAG: hypothetical protein ACFFG0_05075 [Candidatus Thorarchaeota archaeon]